MLLFLSYKWPELARDPSPWIDTLVIGEDNGNFLGFKVN